MEELNKEYYEDLACKIANEEFSYYLQDYGAETEDPELQKLFDDGKMALDAIEAYFRSKGVELREF